MEKNIEMKRKKGTNRETAHRKKRRKRKKKKK